MAAISPAVRRLVLELSERQADALTAAIADSSDIAPEIARLQGLALSSVYRIVISEAGQRTVKRHSQARIARELHPIIEHVLDELDLWFNAS